MQKIILAATIMLLVGCTVQEVSCKNLTKEIEECKNSCREQYQQNNNNFNEYNWFIEPNSTCTCTIDYQ